MKLRILLAAIAIAAPLSAAPPQIAFKAPRFEVTVTPGASIAYIYVIGSNGRAGGVLTDTDGDGKIAIEAGVSSLPGSHGIAVVDTVTGDYASASYQQLIALSARSILAGTSGAFTELVIERSQVVALWVRPGVGVWAPAALVLEDADGKVENDLIYGSVTSFQPVGASPPAPAAFARGDRLFHIGTESPFVQGGLVDPRLDDPPYGGFVTLLDFDGPQAVEGNDLVVTIFRVLGTQGTISVKLKLGELGGSALPGRDYVAVDPTVTFGPGELIKRHHIPTIDDAVWAPPRGVSSRLTEPVGTTTVSPANQTLGIHDNDPAPLFAIEGLPATITETDAPQTLTGTITVANARRVPVTVRGKVGDTDTQLVFQPDESRKDISLTIPGDDVATPGTARTVSLELVETGQRLSHVIQIADDDLPTMTVSDASALEGSSVTLQPSIAPFVPQDVQYKWTTVDGTAKAGSDYIAASGTRGTSMMIRFLADTEVEGTETFYVDFTEVQKVNPSSLRVAITIFDDDGLAPPVFSNLRAVEGNEYGWRPFPATLTLPAALPHPITYKIDVADGTATWQRDYTANNGSVTFQAGQTAADVFVQILGDDVPEGDETFTLSIAGTNSTAVYTIVDDDTGSVPSMTIEDVRIVERTGDDHIAKVRVSLSAPATHLVRVDFETSPGTATYITDYLPPFDGTLNFAPGTTVRELSVRITADAIAEPDEQMSITLLRPAGATLVKSVGTVTIVDDDSAQPPPEPGGRRRSVRH